MVAPVCAEQRSQSTSSRSALRFGMDSNNYSFAGIEIHPSTREVLAINGTAELEPRAFDLLLYLVDHRDRVVTKEELLDKIWKTPHVSESVLARAVMKLRKGIADVGGNPDMIKTIHRVGYRFLGDDKEHHPAMLSPVPSSRFALLPFSNQTGDPLMAWVELGLNTLVARQIAAGSGASALLIEEVLRALAPDADQVPPAMQAAAVKRAFGVDSVFWVAVTRAANGSYGLRWQAWMRHDECRTGALEGAVLTSLAAPLAAIFQALLLPDLAVKPVRLLSSDEEFMDAAHARALHAFASHKYAQALALIEICLAIPHPLQVDVDHIEILTMLDAARASETGRALLEQIDVSTHPQEKLTLLCALGQSAMTARDWNRCEQLCDQIDAILTHLPDEFSTQWSWYLRFEIAHEHGQINTARHLARQAVQHYRDRHDHLNSVGWLTELAKLELSKGDWHRGRLLVDESLETSRASGIPPSFIANALINLALTSIWRGLVPDALALLEEALPMARSQGTALVLAATYFNLFLGHCEAGDTASALQALSDAQPFIDRTATRLLAYGGADVESEIRFGSLDKGYRIAAAALDDLLAVQGVHHTFGTYVNGLIAFGALDDAERLLDGASDYQAASSSPAHWNYLHALAHLAYARRRPAQVVELLDQYINGRGSLVASFQGATDLLWMQLEVGNIEAARTIGAAIPDHLVNSVRGRLCSARLEFVNGEFAAAVQIQQQLVARSSGRRALPYLEQLQHFYERSRASEKPGKFPRSVLLPSLL